jgi:hypothetical protein
MRPLPSSVIGKPGIPGCSSRTSSRGRSISKARPGAWLIGTLEPGKLADFAILNQDFLSVPVERIGTTASLLTVVGGKTVYAADEFSHVR